MHSIQAQTNLTRRINNQRRLSVHDRSTVMFSSPADRSSYFDGAYQGEWKFQLETGSAFDSNAQTDATGVSDWHWDNKANLGYDWWISKDMGLVITPSIYKDSSRFDTQSDLDSNILGTGLSVAILDKLPVDMELNYLGSWGFSGDFDDHVLTQHDVGLSIAKSLPLARTEDGSPDDDGPSIEWRLGGGHVFSDPTSDDQAHGDASVEVALPINERLKMILVTSVSYVSYTDGSVGDRDAWLQEASAALEYQPVQSKDLYLVAGVGYTRRADSDPASDYDQWLVSLGIRFDWEHVGFNIFKN